MFGEFGFGPLSAVIVADDIDNAVCLHKLGIRFDNLGGVEWWTSGANCVENDAVLIVEMGYRQSKCVVSAARRVDETKILVDVR